MLIEVVRPDQKAFAERLVTYHNYGQRGLADGDEQEQMTGMLGQTVFADLIGAERPQEDEDNEHNENGFDGGFDFIINDLKVDVKTMGRTTEMRDNYVHNFIAYQRDYDVDYYVFLSYNRTNEHLTVCGYIDKENFFRRARFYDEGTRRFRTDGTSFKTKAPMYEIKQSDLYPINSIEDIREGIRK